jgi:hypothetical protein
MASFTLKRQLSFSEYVLVRLQPLACKVCVIILENQ